MRIPVQRSVHMQVPAAVADGVERLRREYLHLLRPPPAALPASQDPHQKVFTRLLGEELVTTENLK